MSILVVVAIVIGTVATSEVICPYAAGCWCTSSEIRCVWSHLDQLPALVDNATGYPRIMDISHNNICVIDDGALPTNITEFIAKSNPLGSLGSHALRQSSGTLQKFYVQPGLLSELPLALLDLDVLTKLYIRQNLIKNLTLLGNLSSGVVDMNFEGNQICDHLHLPDAFRPHESTLEQLGMIDNCLTQMPDLSRLSVLQNLNLAHNNISSFESHYLPASLTNLYLFNNELTHLPSSLYSLMNLQWLDLDHNNIDNIDNVEFPSNLTTTLLTNNNLKSIAIFRFTNHTSNMKTLYLSDNPISSVAPNAFEELIKLTYLNLGNTQLTRLPVALKDLASVQYLIMTDVANLTCTCQEAAPILPWYQSRCPMTLVGQCQGTDLNYFMEQLAPGCGPPSKDLPTTSMSPNESN